MAEEIPFRNEDKLAALLHRAKMVTRNVFGDNSKYLKNLDEISFWSSFSVDPVTEGNYWKSGNAEIIALFNTMIEEIKIFGPKENEDSQDKPKEDTTDKSEIDIKKSELESILKEQKNSYFDFSVFISHADIDYLSLHELSLEMIDNKIKPVFWFRVIKDESVRVKLIEEIHKTDIFLIFLSPNSVASQLTNNEIGFIEGKKFYKKFKGDVVLRLYDKHNLKRDHCEGFYGLFDDGISFDPTLISDRKKVVNTLIEMWGSIEKTKISSDMALNEEALIDMIPQIIQFFYTHENQHLNFPKARFICEYIKERSDRYEIIDPREWYNIYELISWINAIHVEIFDEFKMKLKSYLEILNKEIGSGFKL